MTARSAKPAAIGEKGTPGGARAQRIAEQVREACSMFGVATLTVVIGKPVSPAEVDQLLAAPEVASLVLCARTDEEAVHASERIGSIDVEANAWSLPLRLGQALLVLEVARFRPSFFMAASAVKRGITSYIVRDLLKFQRRNFMAAAGQRVVRRAGLQTLDLLRTVEVRAAAPSSSWHYRALNTGNIAGKAARFLMRTSEQMAVRGTAAGPGDLSLDSDPLLSRSEFVPGRVLMFNSALAWGGAERQLVNTILGIAERGLDVSLVCEALGYVPDSEFFRWRFERTNIEVSQIRRQTEDYMSDGDLPPTLPPELVAALSARVGMLPEPLRSTVVPYALEILARRPEIVHAWQDQTSVAAGVAAVVTGVPKILLSTRNVSPPNFSYFQPHMRDTYRALAQVPHVRINNNSDAGRQDYAAWLDISRSTIARLYNGLDFDLMSVPPAAEVAQFRKELGIPEHHKVVGSVFRLYTEKDPLLWLDMADRVAKARPDTTFIIVGTGPMREELLARAAAGPIGKRLLLPGTLQRPERALAFMDVFVLTSRFEGLPNVVIEAQSAGVPVVATRAGGTGEAFLPGETGWLVEEREASRLAEKVLAVLADERWARDARAKAPEFVKQRFGLERMIDETLALYASIGEA